MGQWCDLLGEAARSYQSNPNVFEYKSGPGEYPIYETLAAIAKFFLVIATIGCVEENYHDWLGRSVVFSNPDGMTEWMPAAELIFNLTPGDLIEFEPNTDKGYGTHWAIYKTGTRGQPQVIHLWNAPFVRIDDINYVAADGRRVRRNNKYDLAFLPQKAEEIMDCARQLLGYSSYHLLQSNCEHFAVYCRNGKYISAQANKAKIDFAQVPLLGNLALEAVAMFHKVQVSSGSGRQDL